MNADRRRPKKIYGVSGLGLLGVFFLLLFIAEAAAQSGRYDDWHPMMRGWGVGGFGMFFTLALWILAVAVIVWIVRWLFRLGGRTTGAGAGSGAQAMEILKERYARGEIDKSQYDAMKRDIMGP